MMWDGATEVARVVSYLFGSAFYGTLAYRLMADGPRKTWALLTRKDES